MGLKLLDCVAGAALLAHAARADSGGSSGGGASGAPPSCVGLERLLNSDPPPGFGSSPYSASSGKCGQAECSRIADTPELFERGCDDVCCVSLSRAQSGPDCSNICASLAIASATETAGALDASLSKMRQQTIAIVGPELGCLMCAILP